MSYTWSVSPTKGVTIPDQNVVSPTYSFSIGGTYTLYLKVKDSTGTGSATSLITISKNAVANFNANFEEEGFPNRLELFNYSVGQLKSFWTFSDQTAVDSSHNTKKDYISSGNYTVTLIALGPKGCNDSRSYFFRIADSSGVTLPNVFTPNNDGVNEVLKPIARGIHTLRAYVYGRHGNLLASWDRVGGSWDGRTTAGEACAPGVYFIILEAYGFDGRVYKFNQAVTLVR